MKKIGLTGNIASGKTTVEHILQNLGYKVIDADYICHEAMENNRIITEKIKNTFAEKDILDERGNLSREKIGEIVFSSPKYKSQLENILHPFVISEIEKFFEENQKEKIVFASAALLFEANMKNMFDRIIFVSSFENLRLKRLQVRNKLSEDEALKRIFAQEKEDDKIKKSDFVICNNGNLEELHNKTEEVLKKL